MLAALSTLASMSALLISTEGLNGLYAYIMAIVLVFDSPLCGRYRLGVPSDDGSNILTL